MKLYLASFLQNEFFGPGRIFGIVNGPKPLNIDVNLQYKPFIPPLALINKYNQLAAEDPKTAGEYFVSQYQLQLTAFIKELREAAALEKVDPKSLLPFQDGDTLCSWERNYRHNYRKVLAPFLEELGFEVVLN